MVHIIEGANTTAQWYADDFDSAVFSHLEKCVLHTTETEGFPGYSGGASAPNVTLDCKTLAVRQHFPNNESSRALRDPSNTIVRENRDNVWQIEMICYSDKSLAIERGGLWVGNLSDACYAKIAKMLIQLNKDLGLPLVSTVIWSPTGTGVRLSGPQYDAYKGILGHMHVSGNVHWDPGAFSWPKLQAAIMAQIGEDMPLTATDLAAIRKECIAALTTPLPYQSPGVKNYATLIGAGPMSVKTATEYIWHFWIMNAKGNGPVFNAVMNAIKAVGNAVAQDSANDLTPEQLDQIITDAMAGVVDVSVTVKDEVNP